ncbi:MAG: hypothetical protein F6K21_15105 [Symploca sp. SIO2D2]|nr:hypothetical protein [Symploca sp. SIO2D2]
MTTDSGVPHCSAKRCIFGCHIPKMLMRRPLRLVCSSLFCLTTASLSTGDKLPNSDELRLFDEGLSLIPKWLEEAGLDQKAINFADAVGNC